MSNTIETTKTTKTSCSLFSAITKAHFHTSPIESSSLERNIFIIGKTEAWEVHESHGLMLEGTDQEICMHSNLWCKGMAVPYQASDCTLSLRTAANWTRVLMRHRRFHFMDVWHDVWHNVCIVWFSCSTERSKRGKCDYMIWKEVAATLRSPNWLTGYGLIVVDSSTSLHSPPPLVFAIMIFHGLPWSSRLECM
jgi:hypothetical protein